MTPALVGEASIWCRSTMNESVAEAEQRVDAIMEKRIGGAHLELGMQLLNKVREEVAPSPRSRPIPTLMAAR